MTTSMSKKLGRIRRVFLLYRGIGYTRVRSLQLARTWGQQTRQEAKWSAEYHLAKMQARMI